MNRRVRFVIGVFVGCALGVAGTVGYLVTRPAPIVVGGEALPAEPPVSVTLGEELLTALVREAVARTPQAQIVEGLTVEARDGVMTVRANVSLFGRWTAASTTVRPRLVDGELRIDVTGARVGALPMPVERVIEREINARLTALLANLPVTLTGVAVREGRGLVVTCRVDLARLYAGR